MSESSIGLAYDRWKRQQIEDANRILQEGNLERAVTHAKASRDKLRDQMEGSKGYVKYSRQLAEQNDRREQTLARQSGSDRFNEGHALRQTDRHCLTGRAHHV